MTHDPRLTTDLLEQSAWLKRLAGSLLRDGHAADDLSQDVMAAALVARPELSGVRLRGWLRKVTLRMAGRAAERERGRRYAEGSVAKPEAAEQEAEAHLRLHRQLADAIEAIEEPYRTALIFRYFEDLQPMAIAKRIGISPAAARKRVSRGLALLRARLDRDFDGGREAWSLALLGLVKPGYPVGLAAPTAAITSLTLVTLMTKKFAIMFVGLCLVVGLMWITDPLGKVATDPVGGPGDEIKIRTAAGAGSITLDDSSAAVANPRQAIEKAEQVTAAQVQVVDKNGEPVTDAKAAWVDSTGEAHRLFLDDMAGAVRPSNSSGCRFFASADGYGGAFSQAGEEGSEVTITLLGSVELRGRLVEDGGSPTRPAWLRLYSGAAGHGLNPDEYRLKNELQALGAFRKFDGVATDPDGRFRFAGLRVGWAGSVILPTTHRALAVDGVRRSSDMLSSFVSVKAGPNEVLIETTKLPSVYGRVVWDHDSSPVSGSLNVVLHERQGTSSTMMSLMIGPDGRFEIGLPIVDPAAQDLSARGDSSLIHSRIRITIKPDHGVSIPMRRTVELASKTFPMEIGVIRLRRARILSVHVHDIAGQAVTQAAVSSRVDNAMTDIHGVARLSVTDDDELQILSAGFSLAVVTSPIPTGDDAEPFEVLLEHGSALRIRNDGTTLSRSHTIELFWQKTPFQHLPGANKTPFPYGIHKAFYRGLGSELAGSTWSFAKPGIPGKIQLKMPPEGDLFVPGLRTGERVTVRVVGALQQTLFEHEQELAGRPETHTIQIHLDDQLGRSENIEVQLVDSSGTPIASGQVTARRGSGSSGKSATFKCDAHGKAQVQLGPLQDGSYTLKTRANGFMPREMIRAVGDDSKSLVIELEPSRSLHVTVTDTLGRTLGLRSLFLVADNEWQSSPRRISRGVVQGVVRIRDVPLRAVVATALVGTRVWTRKIDASQTEVAINLPAHGELLIELKGQPRSGSSGKIKAHVTRGGKEVSLAQSFGEKAVWPLQLHSDLLPGTYSVVVTHDDGDEVSEVDRRDITISGGTLTRIDLTP